MSVIWHHVKGTDCTGGKINGCGVIRSVAYSLSGLKWNVHSGQKKRRYPIEYSVFTTFSLF